MQPVLLQVGYTKATAKLAMMILVRSLIQLARAALAKPARF
jgi:hypothetical protein